MIELLNSIGHIIVATFTAFTISVSSLLSTPTITPSPTSISTPSPTVQAKLIEAYAEYRYQGYEEKIYLKIPENGGNVEGYLKGDCDGSIRGTYDGQTKLEGTAQGKCKVVIFTFNAEAKWSGTIDKSAGILVINYKGTGGGFEKSGEITITFNPVK